MVRAPPQVILPIFVIMYIVVNRYSKKCAFNRIGLKKTKCMQEWGCDEWG